LTRRFIYGITCFYLGITSTRKFLCTVCTSFFRNWHSLHPSFFQGLITNLTNTEYPTMVLLCFSCSTPCKSAKGLENHLKSRPGCLADLGILPSANWSKILGLSTSNTSSNPATNEHTFPVEPDPICAAKRPVQVMWGDKNNDNFPSSCFSPDSPQKALKQCSVASVRGVRNATLTIEHRCGSKQIQMTLDEDAVLGLLKNKGLLGVEDTHSLSQAQIQRIQNMLDPNNEECFIENVLFVQQSVIDQSCHQHYQNGYP
jgi:hypothetical protein